MCLIIVISYCVFQAKMGYKEGSGLGKNAQGRTEIIEASQQRGRRGLGLTVKGLEPSGDVEWSEESDQVTSKCIQIFYIVTGITFSTFCFTEPLFVLKFSLTASFHREGS